MTRLLSKLAIGLVALAGTLAHAGGPLSVCNSVPPVPLKYSTASVALNYDGGGVLGSRSKAQADAIVTSAISLWTNVATSTITLSRGADLGVDVNVGNYSSYYTQFGDGLNPVIYDTDGSIVDTLLGVGAKSSVLGFAGSAYTLAPGCQYVEGRAVINGFVSVTDATMTVVIAHEIGHLIGLDHSQLDGGQGLATSNFPLMYPIAYRSSISLGDDDLAAVSALYPDATLNNVYGQVTGNFTLADGVTAVRGANIWAQEMASGKVYSIVSDFLLQNTGYFKLLLPAGTYTLHAEAIQSDFDGGSSVGPYSETYPTDPSFQPPLYNAGAPMAPLTLGNAAPVQFAISPACAATAVFRINGTGSVSGNCASSGPSNVALASAGASASASSTYGTWFASRTIDGERAGVNWSGGAGGWVDNTAGAYPDWLQIDFNGSKTIDRVVVYTLQDNYPSPVQPSDTMTFSTYGLIDFTVQGWNGTAWVTLATVTGNNLVKRTVTFAAFTTSRIRVNATNGGGGYSRITEVEAWGVAATTPATPASSNVALASAGAAASASSTYGTWFASRTIDGERAGVNWSGGGGGWVDNTAGAYPDWLQIDFNGSKSIDRVVVYTLQDNYPSPVEPTDTMTFGTYGLMDFTIQGWNGSTWVTLATVTNNNLVKRTVTFAAFTTSRIRVNATRGGGGYSRITEVEAWGVAATSTAPVSSNVALATAGAAASASSTYGTWFAPRTIDGERAGVNWSGGGGGWVDNTAGAYPDWLQIDFNGSKTIDRVVVYTLQDNYPSPVEPSDTMTFTTYGLIDFTIQGWNGSTWVTLATVTGNNLVKRTVSFSAFATPRIRVSATNGGGGYSRITEVEAWGS